jgi:galactokinase
MSIKHKVIAQFEHHFGEAPAFVVRAPGRVNLIGEHTDYNDGFVLPMAIDRAVWLALRPRYDRQTSIYSIDYEETDSFQLDYLEKGSGWLEYVKGVTWSLTEEGYPLLGFDATMGGDVPIGAGLSSSAALEMAVARAYSAICGWAWDPARMATVCQRAEQQWVGMNSGIMDQLISGVGKAGMAVLLDCRTLFPAPVPLPPDAVVVVLDTGTRRGLVDSAYNQRRAECEAAAEFFGVPALRDVTMAMFEARQDELDPVTRRRARHVISENDRTVRATQVMRSGDSAGLGNLMNASHESLRYDFEVTNDALNQIVDCARVHEACFGARMTGAGFGGCAVALVRFGAEADFAEQVAAAYEQASGLEPSVYVCRAADGASVDPK